MKPEVFNTLVETVLTETKYTLIKKAEEYSNETDRLHNFTKGGRRRNQSRSLTLFGMMEKHAISVDDIVNTVEAIKHGITPAGKFPSNELIKEKLGDMRNYLILLEACIEDDRNDLELVTIQLTANTAEPKTIFRQKNTVSYDLQGNKMTTSRLIPEAESHVWVDPPLILKPINKRGKSCRK